MSATFWTLVAMTVLRFKKGYVIYLILLLLFLFGSWENKWNERKQSWRSRSRGRERESLSHTTNLNVLWSLFSRYLSFWNLNISILITFNKSWMLNIRWSSSYHWIVFLILKSGLCPPNPTTCKNNDIFTIEKGGEFLDTAFRSSWCWVCSYRPGKERERSDDERDRSLPSLPSHQHQHPTPTLT